MWVRGQREWEQTGGPRRKSQRDGREGKPAGGDKEGDSGGGWRYIEGCYPGSVQHLSEAREERQGGAGVARLSPPGVLGRAGCPAYRHPQPTCSWPGLCIGSCVAGTVLGSSQETSTQGHEHVTSLMADAVLFHRTVGAGAPGGCWGGSARTGRQGRAQRGQGSVTYNGCCQPGHWRLAVPLPDGQEDHSHGRKGPITLQSPPLAML